MNLPKCSPEEAYEKWRAICLAAHHADPNPSDERIDVCEAAVQKIEEALSLLSNGERSIILDMFLLDMVAFAEKSNAIRMVQ